MKGEPERKIVNIKLCGKYCNDNFKVYGSTILMLLPLLLLLMIKMMMAMIIIMML